MTVTSSAAYGGPYVADGVTRSFPFPFAAQSFGEVAVVRQAANGTQTAMTGYSVTLNADSGGTVSFSSAPAAGDPIYIYSDPLFQQQTTFQNQGAYSPSALDKALDKLAILSIALKSKWTRAILAPVGELIALTLPTAAVRANSVLGFDSSGNPVAVATPLVAKGDPGSPGEGYGTRMAMAARLSPQVGDDVYLTENKRQGKFIVDLASNWTSPTTADTLKAAFVLSTADATKVYVREQVYYGAYLHIDWFGAYGDGVTDDTAAFNAARTLLSSLGTLAGSGLKGGMPLHLGPKVYLLASSFSWKGCSNVWKGTDSGLATFATGAGTTILMASGCTFIVERANTENGTTGTGISAYSGESTSFYHIRFAGPGQGVGSAPVVKLRARAFFYRCRFMQGGSHGCQIDASAGSGGATEGNANCWQFEGCGYVANGGSGLAIGTVASADVNGGCCVGGTFEGNSRYGVEHAGFLGDRFFGSHFTSNTLGHVKQTNANAVCVFDGYYEGGTPNSTLAGRSYATGPGAGITFDGYPVISANSNLIEIGGTGLQVDGDAYVNGAVRLGSIITIGGTQVIASRYTGNPGVGTDLTSVLAWATFVNTALMNHHGLIS